LITIIDNLLPSRYADEIEVFCKSHLQWTYKKYTSYDDPVKDNALIDVNTYDGGQFISHIFHKDDTNYPHFFFNTLKPLIWTAQDKAPDLCIGGIERVKVNMLMQNETFPDNHYNLAHWDSNNSNYSMIYYVNDSDGDTVLFNEFYGDQFDCFTVMERIKPKKNSAIIFDSKRMHASSNPKITSERYVINFVLENVIAS